MYEIYENHAYEYDELVRWEDYKGNLPKKLNELFDFSGKRVLEFGAGTGRLTALYAEKSERIHCYDRSSHMLEKARGNLSRFGDKISYDLCDNNAIESVRIKGDFVVEGWSFGHTVSDGDHIENAREKAQELILKSLNCLNPGGTAIFIETLGTDSDEPSAPSEALKEYYRLLEEKHGFSRVEISTDYRFKSADHAGELCGFFFGQEAGEEIRQKGSPYVKEFTGLWYKSI